MDNLTQPYQKTRTDEISEQSMFFKPVWQETPLIIEDLGSGLPEVILFFGNIPSDFQDTFTSSRIIQINAKDRFQKITNGYEIVANNFDDYSFLLQEVEDSSILIVFAWPLMLGSNLSFDELFEYGPNSFFLLTKALLANKKIRKAKLQYFYRGSLKKNYPLHAGLKGFNKTLALENPNFPAKIIAIDNTDVSLISKQEYFLDSITDLICYQNNIRNIQVLESVTQNVISFSGITIRNEGVYLISGGAGELGIIFTEYLAAKDTATFILVGRSKLSVEKEKKIKEISHKTRSLILYYQTDITNKVEVWNLIHKIHLSHGSINGVIHAAGILKDSFLLKKQQDDWNQVIATKIKSANYLDEFLKNDPLDFFIFFSSISAMIGSVGQADYAYANSYLNVFSEQRNNLIIDKLRRGKTIAINWPFWKKGGMYLPKEQINLMKEVADVLPLATKNGISAFEKINGFNEPIVLFIKGNKIKIKHMINHNSSTIITKQKSPEEQKRLKEKVEKFFKQLLAEEIKLPASKIKSNAPLENYGIDSMMIMSLTQKLEELFGNLSKTLFFEYQTLDELIDYFIENHFDKLLIQVDPKAFNPISNKQSIKEEGRPFRKFRFQTKIPQQEEQKLNEEEKTSEVEEIAIIGVSGRYPNANTLDEFWENLKEGRDSITEIPEGRWDWKSDFSPKKGEAGKYYSKWGGFMDDVDKFDPLFFNISPLEAQLIDPQERLFMETIWHTLENACYTKSQLSGKKIGVYVGVMYGQYQLHTTSEEGFVPSSSFASIANRVSYYFNFTGPSIGVDTMCSSSLTSIHLACNSILSGESEMAFAGGVNISAHPHKYKLLSQSQFASSDGRCHSFGEGGDGYVPGEGVGAVLLKPLSNAIKDNDNIYAVIKGSALNHGGKTNGYTVPNPKAQANLIKSVLEDSKISADTIGYIEAHGTGTSLGDPIEIAGLNKAFGTFKKKASCAVGSVKSNIGHLESAAGIAAITKVLLQMRHQQLVPSIHSQKENPNLQLEDSAFYIHKKLTTWNRPEVIRNNKTVTYPLRAGISSFGAGGANAHVILEEYIGNSANKNNNDTISKTQIIPLSAKNEEQLLKNAHKLLHFLKNKTNSSQKYHIREILKTVKSIVSQIFKIEEKHIDVEEELVSQGFSTVEISAFKTKVNNILDIKLGDDIVHEGNTLKKIAESIIQLIDPNNLNNTVVDQNVQLQDIAFSLQVGREAFSYRLVFTANTIGEAIQKLDDFLNKKVSNTPEIKIYKCNSDIENVLDSDEIDILSKEKQYNSIMEQWSKGARINWNLLHYPDTPNRIPLPEYAFTRERYWLGIQNTTQTSKDYTENTTITKLTEDIMKVTEKTDLPSEELSVIKLQKLLITDITKETASLIKLNPKRLDPKENLGTYGFESMTFVKLSENLNEIYKIDITPAIFFEKGTLEMLVEYLISEYRETLISHYTNTIAQRIKPMITQQNVSPKTLGNNKKVAYIDNHKEQDDIAIIGISGRFPGTKNLNEWWEKLENEVDLISEVPLDRWDWKKYDANHVNGSHKTRSSWGGFIPDADKFDAAFFNISPAEAEMMDPQQRVFLETVWHTIENAGYKASDFSGRKVGIFSGVQFHDYQYLLANNGELNPHMGLGNEHSILVNRASFFLNSHGPSEPHNTACSSALVALNRAVDSIQKGESEVALAGGVTLMLDPLVTVSADNLGILSPDGRCKTLDASANGYVRGEGVGLVLLKPLHKAKKDGDHIYAVIKGTAVNHGGKASSLTAPNSKAQADLLTEAFSKAQFDPETISYLELHGTGTKLGDPVEIQGISSAFKNLATKQNKTINKNGYCGIGSVKTNIGHLEPASGIAGLLKLILSFGYGKLPGILHLNEQNPYIKLENSPFYIVKNTQEWKRLKDQNGEDIPRRAGVSSFGFGGVNAHVVLEEYEKEISVNGNEKLVFVLSAKTEERLKVYSQLFLQFLKDKELGNLIYSPTLDEIAYTLQIGRENLSYRWCCIANSEEQLIENLKSYIEDKQSDAFLTGKERSFENDAINEDDVEIALESKNLEQLIKYWASGTQIDWTRIYTPENRPNRAPLPVYPFERKRHWFTPKSKLEAINEHNTTDYQLDAPNEAITDRYQYVLNYLIATVESKLEVENMEIGEDTNFNEIGVDSIMSSFIMQIIQEQFSNEIPLSALMEYPILGSLARYITDKFLPEDFVNSNHRSNSYTSESTSKDLRNKLPSEILPINTKGTKQTSFWIHGATGFSTFFKDLSNILGSDYPLYAFQARGTDGKSMPHTFEEMVAHYINCIKIIQPEGPYFLGGYSFGGLVAYEIARRLNEQGNKIKHLVMLEAFPTTGTVNEKFYETYDFDFLKLYLVNSFLNIKEKPELIITKDDILDVPQRMRVGHLAKLAKEKANLLIPVDDIYNYIKGGLICSDYAEEAYKTIQIDKPYDGSNVLYFRTTKGFIGEENLLNWDSLDIYALYDYITPWKNLIKKEVKVIPVNSDHFSILEEPTLSVVASKVERVLNEPDMEDFRMYDVFKKQFNEVNNFICYPILKAFKSEGFFLKKGEKNTHKGIRDKIGVLPKYERFAEELVDILIKNRFLRKEGKYLVCTENINSLQTRKALKGIDDKLIMFSKEYKQVSNYLPLLKACINEFKKVWNGNLQGVEVIFSQGCTKLVDPIYTGNFQMDYYNNLVANSIKTYIKNKLRIYPNTRINILEVGSGTGATSKIVFDVIREYSKKITYYYTDIAPMFLQIAKQQFLEKNPFIEFTILDINKPFNAQGYEPESVDIVLGSNVLHTCRLIDPVLKHIYEVLKPKGMILINELTQKLNYNTLTFGLLNDWWQYEDEKLRIKGSPLFTNQQWSKLLRKNGFVNNEIKGIDSNNPKSMAQSLIVGKK